MGTNISADAPAPALIPAPMSAEYTEGTFTLTADTIIMTDTPELAKVAQYLATLLAPATGYSLPVSVVSDDMPPPIRPGSIFLTQSVVDSLGPEGYELLIAPTIVILSAPQSSGIFHGIQTLRQLLPPSIESQTVQAGPWTIPAGTITDSPRYEWRGAMLDVARHFFSVEDVKRYIDLLAAYKINRLHLHLADDQGWRIEIKSWPNLTLHGSSTEVGGGEGGFYTQDEYAEIVAYARDRFITVIPEIDMPGHTNAALSSYPELNCNDKAPDLYTGTEVGFSSLCIDKDVTYTFLDDVIRELAAITPGPYLHIGGDEARATKEADYVLFMEKVQAIVAKYGKAAVGWEEIGQSTLLPTTIAQHWGGEAVHDAVKQGAKVIMAPASKAYMDMKYDTDTELGLTWAGYISVETGYNWDPATQVSGVAETDILGVEAPLWAETLETIDNIEYMAFPRLLGYAEMGWSPQDARDWDSYKVRLAAFGPRLAAMGVNFFASPEIDWQLVNS